MSSTALPPSFEAAARLGAATMHEAAGRTGALPAGIRPVADGFRVAGPAFPVRCPVGDNLWLHRAIYAAEPGDVLVAAIPGTDAYGYWGEIMSCAAAARGLGGLVIDGGVRDVEQLGEIGFPVFSATVAIRGTVKDPAGAGALGEPVELGDVRVCRGDLVVADTDGVAVVPAERIDEVIEAAERRQQTEAEVMDRLRAGESTLSIFDLPPAP